MDQPFSDEEIKQVLADMLSDHAPGPDGFNGTFMKKCWPMIGDFKRMCQDFATAQLDIKSIIGSFIVLIPKKDNPMTMNDYRPISLLNSALKLLTMLIANRLQVVILTLVHTNQYGFIKEQSIQDCLAWTYQFLHFCHKYKKETIILKLDFEKGFGKVEHHVILEIMQAKGMSQRWISWIRKILTSSTSSVSLNGVLGKSFQCNRGVRQGDPLSPLRFVLTADLLQFIINEVAARKLLFHPIAKNFPADFPIVQYADDTLIIMQGDC